MSINDKIKLFCFPYAGGSGSFYSLWRKYLLSNIELVPVELAGRGKRIKENHYTDLYEAIEDLYNIVNKDISNSEYAFLGHSMGCHIAYYLAHKLKSNTGQNPRHIFFSGMYPPYVKKDKKQIHNLPDNEFINEIFLLGGTPEELLNNSKLLKIFIPILKSDYRIIESYNPKEFINLNLSKFDCDITALNGKYDDKVSEEDINRWKECTNGKFESYIFEGGHFFIHDMAREISIIVNNKLGYRENIT